MATVTQIGPRLGIAPTCAALGLPRSTYYRRRRSQSALPTRARSPRALSAGEQATVLGVLHEPRFVDLAPRRGLRHPPGRGHVSLFRTHLYRSWPSTRRCGSGAISSAIPSMPPPSCWPAGQPSCGAGTSRKLLGPTKWTYFYLYVMLDVFSRYVVGWMVAHRESAKLAERFIHETCARQGIGRNQLTIHADRGPAMTSKPVRVPARRPGDHEDA